MPLSDIAHINPSSIADIGANCAHWYREAKALWPSASFLLIEGNPACQPYLEATGEPVVIAYLGDTRREVSFYKRKGGGTDTGNSYYRELTPFFADDQIEVEKVQLAPLDEIASGRTFDLVKLDCQGAELDILRGGMETISHAKHILLEVALTPYNEGAPMADEVFAFMDSISFPNRQSIGDICHPLDRAKIVQQDVLFSR